MDGSAVFPGSRVLKMDIFQKMASKGAGVWMSRVDALKIKSDEQS